VGRGGKGSSGALEIIRETPGAIGFVQLTYALQQHLKYASIQNREGKFVEASLSSITEAADAALPSIPSDLKFSLTNGPGKDSYPIDGIIWAVIRKIE
jgi:phosphate transport system substrate-binding protein